MNIHRIILLALILLTATPTLRAQMSPNWGTDFFFTVLPNTSGSSGSYPVYIESHQAASVDIYGPNGWHQHRDLGPSASTTVSVPANVVYNSQGVDNHSAHITSTTPISVYVYNRDPAPSALDLSLVFPTTILANDYMVQTYPSVSTASGSSSEFAVVAVEDNTTVDITLTAASGSHAAGSTVHHVLNQGEVARFSSAPGEHFCGTTVHSTGHPVAVFQGNRLCSTNTVSRDHCYHQALPTSHMGTMHVTMPAADHSNDIIRVTALQPATTVVVTGALTNLTHTLATVGESWEFHITEAVSITSNQPMAVAQWQPSRTISNEGGDWGDVAYFPLPPITNMNQRCHFPIIPMDTRYEYQPRHWIHVVAPTSEVGLARIDGAPLTGFTPLGNTGYSYLRKSVSTGHQVTTTGTGLQVVLCGSDENWGAYYALAGYAAPHHETIIDTTIRICPGQSVTFGDTTFTTAGDHQLTHLDANGTLVTTNIHIVEYSTQDIELDKSFCIGGSLTFDGQVIDQEGDYTFESTDIHGCPVHLVVHVTESPTYDLDQDTSICEGEYVYFYNQVYFSGTHTATFRSVDGCDSTVTLTINTRRRHLIDIYDTLRESTYQLGEHTLYSAGNYEFRYTNMEGCDSIVFLHLWAEPCRLWVPNVFTPNEETNNEFFISGCGLLQADIYIYDRGGDYVTDFDGLTETWDGTHHGTPCKPGTYVYRIAYRCTDDTHLEHVKVGSVTLLR